MKLLAPTESDEQARLDFACAWLVSEAPNLSSKILLAREQKLIGFSVLLVLLISVVLFPLDTAIAIVGLLTACYVVILIDRVAKTLKSLHDPDLIVISDAEALSLPDDVLPIYTVLVPLYREGAVVPQLVASLRSLDYPGDRLDVKLIVERDDIETMSRLAEQDIADYEVIAVPPGRPRTKPKALNYGLTFARGELVTIFDAEDRPDVLQLRKAVAAFRQLPETVACLQARLEYWNSGQNLITRLFGIEYLQWFRLLLPGLAASGAPVPLGGTSNHIRRRTLESLGGWDAFNVTEDADLGIRIHRAGLRCAVLDCPTWEEANSDFVNWDNQRSRWYKGYLQTWLVHMRHPRVLFRQLGWRGFLEFNAFIGGTPIFSLINVAFWMLTIAWFAFHAGLIKELFPAVVYYPALFCLVVGNVTMAYLYIVAARLSKQPAMIWASLLVPLYWVMMGLAAVKAVWQLAVNRSLWEKTVHGLTGSSRQVESIAEPVPGQSTPVSDFLVPGPPIVAIDLSTSHVPTMAHKVVRQPVLVSSLSWLAIGLLSIAVYVLIVGGIISSPPSSTEALIPPLPSRVPPGAVIGTLVASQAGLRAIVVQGDRPQLSSGVVGHLSSSSLPGAEGDVVIVGHRVAFGGVFNRLVRVRTGDKLVVYAAGGQAEYRVTAVTTEAGDRLQLTPSVVPQLTLVTSGTGLFEDSLLVVRSELVSETGIHLRHADPVDVRSVVIPALNVGPAGWAGLWLIAAVAALAMFAHLRRHWGIVWALLMLGPVVLVAFSQACLAGGHALPATL